MPPYLSARISPGSPNPNLFFAAKCAPRDVTHLRNHATAMVSPLARFGDPAVTLDTVLGTPMWLCMLNSCRASRRCSMRLKKWRWLGGRSGVGSFARCGCSVFCLSPLFRESHGVECFQFQICRFEIQVHRPPRDFVRGNFCQLLQVADLENCPQQR